jgi:hypothetical protein
MKDGVGYKDAEREWHSLKLMCADVGEVRSENCGTNMVT